MEQKAGPTHIGIALGIGLGIAILASVIATQVLAQEDQKDLGQELYGEHCQSCHGDDANGGTGPGITERDPETIATVLEEVPPMAGRFEFSNDEIAAISEYLRDL